MAAVIPNPGVITVTGSDQLIDPGIGAYTIAFLAGARADTLVLHAGGVDQVSGFDPATDALDLGALLAAANVTLNVDSAALGNYVTIVNQGSNAVVNFDPTGHAGGTAVAVLQGLGDPPGGLAALISQGAIRTT